MTALPSASKPGRTVSPPAAGPDEPALRKLASLISGYAPQDGGFELRLPGVHAFRRSRISREAAHATVGPALCIVAQGSKTVMLGREVYEYNAARMLVFSVDLPVLSHVTKASPARPFLGIVLDLEPYKIAELAMRVYPRGAPKASNNRGLYVEDSTDGIIDAATRLLEFMAQPEDAALLAPLVVEEIFIRLLRSSVGARVAQIGQSESGLRRVSKAVAWVRANFTQAITVEQLADLVHMSVSSFHQRFKSVTTMSPLQYQKVLRLHEARRLMLFHGLEAGAACRQVGYLSASQFSREYARLFGSAPTKDIARLREEGHGTS